MRNKIYKGSSKTLYQAEEDHALIMSFDDSIKLKNGKILTILGKGVINNTISAYIMSRLDMIGIENHLIEKINMRDQLVQYVDIIPIELSVCNVACGRYVSDFGIEEGYVFDHPIIDFRIKNNLLKHPVINEHQIISFGWLTEEEITILKTKAIRIYDFLTGLFIGLGMRLVKCTLEFGKVYNGEDFTILLADEISLDNCRLWDIKTNEKLSLENNDPNLEEALLLYQNVMKRFNWLNYDFN